MKAGEPIRVVGIAQDVTDAKLAEEALRSTSSDLERRAIELPKLASRTAAEPKPAPHAPLTPRQLEILRLVAEGLTSAQVAKRLFLSEATVKWHVKQILTKTGSSHRRRSGRARSRGTGVAPSSAPAPGQLVPLHASESQRSRCCCSPP